MKRTHKVIIMKRIGGIYIESEPLFVTAISDSHAIEIARDYIWRWKCQNEYAHHAVAL